MLMVRDAKRKGPKMTTASKKKLIRVYIGNRQAVGQRCGWGEGCTREQAIQNAIELAGGEARNAKYDVQSGMVWYDGGCIL